LICLSVRIPARQRKHDFNDETVSVLHFEDPPQNTVEKLRLLDDNYLHGSLLPLPPHAADEIISNIENAPNTL